MQDMKEFLDKKKMVYGDRKQPIEYFSIKDLGLFFWKRGGKNYCFNWEGWAETYKRLVDVASKEYANECGYVAQEAQDFLDCVACLGKTKVKELIKNMKERN